MVNQDRDNRTVKLMNIELIEQNMLKNSKIGELDGCR
jgi:hypothetical protein